MTEQITLKDARKSQEHLAKQFSKIGRSLIISNKEAWKLFLEQKESDVIPTEHLPVIESVLLGNPIISIEAYRDLSSDILKELQYCPVMRVLYKISGGDLMPDLVQHYLKMTADVLRAEDLSGSNYK